MTEAEQERERCAQIVESYRYHRPETSEQFFELFRVIAAEIRGDMEKNHE